MDVIKSYHTELREFFSRQKNEFSFSTVYLNMYTIVRETYYFKRESNDLFHMHAYRDCYTLQGTRLIKSELLYKTSINSYRGIIQIIRKIENGYVVIIPTNNFNVNNIVKYSKYIDDNIYYFLNEKNKIVNDNYITASDYIKTSNISSYIYTLAAFYSTYHDFDIIKDSLKKRLNFVKDKIQIMITNENYTVLSISIDYFYDLVKSNKLQSLKNITVKPSC